jgi:catechol 2,3-dioxygenase-like lactoylglutathione lyase family enzyme
VTVESQPLIVVSDVEASSRWYQAVLGLESGHGGWEYERLVAPGGDFILQLHATDTTHDHPGLFDRDRPPSANGVALWFRTEDFDAAVDRARAFGAEVFEGPLFNERAQHHELWLHDPDGYVVVVASRPA